MPPPNVNRAALETLCRHYNLPIFCAFGGRGKQGYHVAEKGG